MFGTIYKCDGLCTICKYNKTPIDGDHCGSCDIDYNNFRPDWVTLISKYFGVSRNYAKKLYHKMIEDYRLRKMMIDIEKRCSNDHK